MSPGHDGVPVGQMGGLHRLPEGMPWPARGSMPLPFIASFDCAARPRVDDLPLPADGSLLFFLHHDRAYDEREEFEKDDEMAYARVLYVLPPQSTSGPNVPRASRSRRGLDRRFRDGSRLGPWQIWFPVISGRGAN